MSDHVAAAGQMACHPADHRPDPDTVDERCAACRNPGCEVELVAMGTCEQCEGRGRDVWGEACFDCYGTGLEGWREKP